MAEVFLICGRICAGKTVYARRLCAERRAVLLSVDEIMLGVFGQDAGERHDVYAARVQSFLFAKSLEILKTGTDVVLDWGFWTRADRTKAKAFYRERNFPCSLHYVCPEDAEWAGRLRRRNGEVRAGETDAYEVDEGLKAKCEALFEEPGPDEVDERI